MSEPLVVCVMLTANRTEFARKAIECWKQQTYENRKLMVFDTSKHHDLNPSPDRRIIWVRTGAVETDTIGKLRNEANAILDGDLICHWDDDDWSHPKRIEHQVGLFESVRGCPEIVGYSNLLFWREAGRRQVGEMSGPLGLHPVFTLNNGEAWLYQSVRPDYAPGTSLMYLREYWKDRPFTSQPRNPEGTGEELDFLKGSRVSTSTSFWWETDDHDSTFPMIVARIHSGNASRYDTYLNASDQWERVAHWETAVGERLEA